MAKKNNVIRLFNFIYSLLLKVPLTPKYFFTKMNLLKCIAAILPFIGFKTCKRLSIFCSRLRQKEIWSTGDLTSQSTLHACLRRVNVM